MTRAEIKKKMMEMIQGHLEEELEDLNFDRFVDEDMILDFLWEKDFGQEIVENYIDEHKKELAEEYLEEIYEEFSTDDFETPW